MRRRIRDDSETSDRGLTTGKYSRIGGWDVEGSLFAFSLPLLTDSLLADYNPSHIKPRGEATLRSFRIASSEEGTSYHRE